MKSEIREYIDKIKNLVNENANTSEFIGRDAFLYLKPQKPENLFAQCGSCMMFTESTCTIHGKDVKITKDMSCGLYVHGKPMPQEKGHEMKLVTPEESGLVKRQVRCENCLSFDGKNKCTLYEILNKTKQFKLDENVEPKACCNAHREK